MAGISIELKKALNRGNIRDIVNTLGYSTLLSSGNWIVAVFSIFFFSQIANLMDIGKDVLIYQVLITYSVAISLIVSGPFQIMFTRYASDRIFEKEEERISPNYLSALLISGSVSFLTGLFLAPFLFKGEDINFRILFPFLLSTLSGLWISNSLLTGIKRYGYIFFSFLLSYSVIGVLMLAFIKKDLFLAFLGFYIGKSLLLCLLASKVLLTYPSKKLIDFDFLKKERAYYSLGIAGLFYNLGIWIDKLLFWFNPSTGTTLFSNLRISVLYDMPVILSYIALIPGMAVFFLKLEGEFAEIHREYYEAVRKWGTLDYLYNLANKMIKSAKAVLFDTLRLQLIVNILIILIQEHIFKLLNISLLYIPLFNILLMGATLQLSFMILFSIISYFDLRKHLALLSITFTLTNLILSLLTLYLGPYFYGYGYTLSLLITNITAMLMLRRFLSEILYRTFMAVS